MTNEATSRAANGQLPARAVTKKFTGGSSHRERVIIDHYRVKVAAPV